MKLVFNKYMYFKINIPYHERSVMAKSKKSQTKSMKNVYHSYKISNADTEINHLIIFGISRAFFSFLNLMFKSKYR